MRDFLQAGGVEVVGLEDELGFGDGEDGFGEDGEAEPGGEFLERAPGGAAAFDGEAEVAAGLGAGRRRRGGRGSRGRNRR